MRNEPGLDAVRVRASFAVLTAVIAVSLALFAILRPSQVSLQPQPAQEAVPTLLQRLDRSNEFHAGYGVYPPYTQEDANTKQVSGFSVDVIEEIAKQLKTRVVWHRLNWNTMSADLKRGTYDVVADPIFQTVPRAREFAFTMPYAYFADGIGTVREGERRFPTFESIDRPGITVAVGQGWASETFVRAQFTRATIRPVQTTTDLLQLFNEVVAGRADIAISDAADAERYAKEHASQVDVLFAENPPTYMPAGFALRPSDREGAEFLSIALRNLEATGVLDALARKYAVTIRPVHTK
jgi:ABC-type amino acid transport substrate-binding protein